LLGPEEFRAYQINLIEIKVRSGTAKTTWRYGDTQHVGPTIVERLRTMKQMLPQGSDRSEKWRLIETCWLHVRNKTP
jgi:hypothetical protein